MNLSKSQLIQLLIQAGLPAIRWQLPDTSYETCSPQFVRANWEAWLQARPESLVMFTNVVGKRIRERPLWMPESGDCDNLALGTMAWADVGNALAAVQAGAPRGGLAYGVIFFNAMPARPDNWYVSGGHAINWHVGHDCTVHFFEPGMGLGVDLNADERSSSWFGIAA